MSPLQIGICMHYFTRAGDYRGDGYLAPIWDETMNGLVGDGLLTFTDDGDQFWHPTEKLHEYCESLTRVPLPVQVWKSIV